jgi:hypothetical protein
MVMYKLQLLQTDFGGSMLCSASFTHSENHTKLIELSVLSLGLCFIASLSMLLRATEAMHASLG